MTAERGRTIPDYVLEGELTVDGERAPAGTIVTVPRGARPALAATGARILTVR